VLGLLEQGDITFNRVWPAVVDDMRRAGAASDPRPIPVTVEFFKAGERWEPGITVVARPPRPGPATDDLPGPSNRLGFRFFADDSDVWGTVRYQKECFDAATIQRLIADLEVLLAAVDRDAALRLSQLPVPGPTGEA